MHRLCVRLTIFKRLDASIVSRISYRGLRCASRPDVIHRFLLNGLTYLYILCDLRGCVLFLGLVCNVRRTLLDLFGYVFI